MLISHFFINVFGLIAVAGTKPKYTFKFIFLFRKKPASKGNCNYTDDLSSMAVIILGEGDKILNLQCCVSNPLEIHLNYRYLKIREIAAVLSRTHYLEYIEYVKTIRQKLKL